ncbi:MAG: TIGR04133 family radical SAM/SPASM protein [Alistipes sp.]|nr:TIGR04133 family radical SAM/SPASM protein [Alistipes sp.]
MNKYPLSLRRRLALEAWRLSENIRIEQHELRQLFWECTLRCNLNCRHCGSDCKSLASQPDMPKEDFLRVLDSVAAHTNPNKVFVVITGGEPLMRPDLEACGREIYKKGFPWGIVTNGLAMTEKRLQSLVGSGMHTITVSLDGLEDEHNFMRGNPQSFKRAVEAIRIISAEKRIKSDVVTCVNRRSIKNLDAIKELLVSLGVTGWRLFTIFPAGRAAKEDDLQLTAEEHRYLMEYIKRNRKEEKRITLNYCCEGFMGDYEGDIRDHFYSCQAGVSVSSVLIDGSIGACASIRADYHQGNIYKDDFWDVWQNRYEVYRNREWMRKGICAECNMFRYCQGNGMHLRDNNGNLLHCNLKKLYEDK